MRLCVETEKNKNKTPVRLHKLNDTWIDTFYSCLCESLAAMRRIIIISAQRNLV